MRPSRAIVVLLAASVLLGGGSATAQTELTIGGYAERLESVRTALGSADASGPSIEAALEPLGLPVRVRLPDGGVIEVTREALVGDAANGGDAEALRRLTARIDAALEGARAAAGAPAPDRASIDTALDAAYEGRRLQEPPIATRIFDRVIEALGWLLDRTLGAVTGSGIGAVIGWLLILGLVVAVLIVVQRAGRATVGDARWTGAGGRGTVTDWRRLADDALARGDLQEAVRALYHVLLTALAARGVVRDDPSLTAGELRAAVRRGVPALAPEVDRATTAFERVVYGRLPARDEDVASLRSAETAVRRR